MGNAFEAALEESIRRIEVSDTERGIQARAFEILSIGVQELEPSEIRSKALKCMLLHFPNAKSLTNSMKWHYFSQICDSDPDVDGLGACFAELFKADSSEDILHLLSKMSLPNHEQGAKAVIDWAIMRMGRDVARHGRVQNMGAYDYFVTAPEPVFLEYVKALEGIKCGQLPAIMEQMQEQRDRSIDLDK